MMRFLLLFGLQIMCIASVSNAQAYDTVLYQKANNFLMQGDYDNALMLFKKLATTTPANYEVVKTYVYASQLRSDFTTALQYGEPLLKSAQADDQLYQIMAAVYSGIGENKKVEKTYKEGIQRFPNSGKLYAELGEWYASQKKENVAIATWEQGIAFAPQEANNYYYATKYYATFNQPFWVIIYGEVFANIDKLSNRNTEVRKLIIDAYKQLLSEPKLLQAAAAQSSFAQAQLTTFWEQRSRFNEGITPEVIAQVRELLLADWQRNQYNNKTPWHIINWWVTLQQQSYLAAYNKWLLGAYGSYEKWQQQYPTEANNFWKWMRSNIYKVPPAQYYHK
jgi:tetratricopeptide (TPR) repeat protein